MSAPWGPWTGPWMRPVGPSLRRPQTVAYPLVTIILGSIVLVWILLAVLLEKRDPGTGIAAIGLCLAWFVVGAAALLWFDRWEPEPPHLVIAAWFWGIGVIPLSSFFGAMFDSVATQGRWQAYVFTPLLAELFKLCFLLLVLLASRRGRNELTSPADAVVYAGFVGLGQGFGVALGEVGHMHTWASVLAASFDHLLLGAHVYVVSAVIAGLGLWFGLVSPAPRRFVAPLVGLAGAVSLAILSGWASNWVAAVLRIACLAGVVWWVQRATRQQDSVLGRHLPAMVDQGWVQPEDANWLATLQGRRDRRRAARLGGARDVARINALRDNVSELAFVRERLDAQGAGGWPLGRELLAQHDELVGLLVQYRHRHPGP